jgi:hypothetical protein
MMVHHMKNLVKVSISMIFPLRISVSEFKNNPDVVINPNYC